MRPVDRVARLEADDGAPPALAEGLAGLGGREAVVREVGVVGEREHFERTRDARVSRFEQGLHPRMLEVIRPVDRESLLGLVPLEALRDAEHRDGRCVGARGERDRGGTADPVGVGVRHAQDDGDRPGQPVRQMHRLEHRVVVGFGLEPSERAEGASSRSLIATLGTLAASLLRASASEPVTSRFTSVPPCGAMGATSFDMDPLFRTLERGPLSVQDTERSRSPTELRHDPEGFAGHVDLQPSVIAQRVPVHLDRERIG